MGVIDIELFPKRAPVTVANFLRYASEGFYDSLIIHRVIPDFIIQGGGFTVTMAPRPATHGPIVNEAPHGLSNLRGTIAMARTSDPHSATSLFFINLKDNTFLDYRNDTTTGFGYAVFGRVVNEMDVVDDIAAVQTGALNGFNDVPITPIVIHGVQEMGGWPWDLSIRSPEQTVRD